MSYILGIDPSLNGTAVATKNYARRINVNHLKVDGRELHTLLRRRHIRHLIMDRWLTGIRLVAIEGMYPMAQSGQNDRAALLGDLVDRIDAAGIPIIIVPPSVLKKFATGNGSADKTMMIDAALRTQLGAPASGDEADALWLAALGHQLAHDPIVHLPAAQLRALDKLGDDSWVRGRPNGIR